VGKSFVVPSDLLNMCAEIITSFCYGYVNARDRKAVHMIIQMIV